MKALLLVARRLWREVIAIPLEAGRWRVSTWPKGLAVVGALTGYLYVVATALVMLAGPIRQYSQLDQVSDQVVLPSAFGPLLMIAFMACFTLVQTAALHAHWTVRVLVLVLFATLLASFAFPAGLGGAAAAVVSLLGLIALHILRAGKHFHVGELLAVTVLSLIGLQLPLMMMSGPLDGYGWRGTQLIVLQQTLMTLAGPAMIAAGAVLTQLAVASGEAVADEVTRIARPVWLWGVLGCAGAWLVWDAVSRVREAGESLNQVRWSGSVLLVLVSCLGAVPFVLRARRVREIESPDPGLVSQRFTPVVYTAAAVAVGAFALVTPLVVASQFLRPLLPPDALSTLNAAAGIMTTPWGAPATKAVAGLVVLGLGWWRACRGDAITGVLAVAFASARLFNLVSALAPSSVGDFFATSSAGVQTALVGVVAASAAVAIARGRWTRDGVSGVLAAALICVAYPWREWIAEPLAALLGFSTVAVLLVGLAWRALTDGDFVHDDTPALPRATRILLFLANTLFASSVLALSALSRLRDAGGGIDLWESLGDGFAEALLIGAVLWALMPGYLSRRRVGVVPGAPVGTAQSGNLSR